MESKIIHYEAKAAPGIIFPSKTYILPDQDQILVISPSELDEEIINELKESQKRLVIIAPNNFHNLYLNRIKSVFPNAKYYGPKRSAKQSGVDLLPLKELKTNEIELIPIQGAPALGEVCFYHKPTRKLYVTDLFFNMQHKMNLPMMIMTTFAGTRGHLGTSRLLKMLIKDKKAFQESVQYMISLEADEVIPNHGDPISQSEFIEWSKKL